MRPSPSPARPSSSRACPAGAWRRTSSERARLGWAPEAALFSDDFGGAEKQLAPLLEILALEPSDAVYIGDTAHDRTCAALAGVPFALAGWNPRARAGAQPGDHVLDHPADVLDLLRSPA